MKIHPLPPTLDVYRCVDYLVLGSWNRLEDVNTLVDAGGDPNLIGEIRNINTGVGKRAVEQVVLTHNHFDHTSALAELIRLFHPRIYAFTKTGVITDTLTNGQILQMGDREFEVIHFPIHSHDSVCLYNKEDRVLFSGDNILDLKTPGGTYPYKYVTLLDKLASLAIDIVYPGHGDPMTGDIGGILEMTLKNVSLSQVY